MNKDCQILFLKCLMLKSAYQFYIDTEILIITFWVETPENLHQIYIFLSQFEIRRKCVKYI